jgi:hypothetical protein
MGEFYYSVQVYAGEGGGQEMLPRLLDAVRLNADEIGFTITDDEDTDRDMLVSLPGPGRWITIYDDITGLDALAERLSALLSTPTVVLADGDGESVEARLFRDGKSVDYVEVRPDYYTEHHTAKEKEALAGHPALWKDLLASGKQPADLQAAWQDVHGMIGATAECLGMDRHAVCNNLEYELKDGEDLPARFVRIGFRAKEPPLFRVKGEGPPIIEMILHTPETTVEKGSSFALEMGARNKGMASRGLSVIVWGPAIDEGIVTIESARARPPIKQDRERLPLEEAIKRAREMTPVKLPDPLPFTPQTIETTKGKAEALICRFDDFDVVQGLAAPMGGEFGTIWWRKSMDAVYETRFHIDINCKALKPGKGGLHLVVAPNENARAGQAGGHADIRVLAQPRTSKAKK